MRLRPPLERSPLHAVYQVLCHAPARPSYYRRDYGAYCCYHYKRATENIAALKGLPVLEELSRRDKNLPSRGPLIHDIQPDTFKRYIGVWRRVIYYIHTLVRWSDPRPPFVQLRDVIRPHVEKHRGGRRFLCTSLAAKLAPGAPPSAWVLIPECPASKIGISSNNDGHAELYLDLIITALRDELVKCTDMLIIAAFRGEVEFLINQLRRRIVKRTMILKEQGNIRIYTVDGS